MGIILSVVGIVLAIIGLIVSIIFGILQLIAHSGKGELKFLKRFPFVTISPEGTVPERAVTKAHKRKRKKRSIRKILVPVFVAVVLGILLLLLSTFLRGELRQTTMAVMAFKNRTGEGSFDYLSEAIPNLLITDLEQSKYLSVMTWERMHDLLKVMGKEDVEEIDEELAFELCKMEGIEAIVLGSFTKAGEMFATEAKVLNVETKKIRMSTSSKGEGKASILKSQIDELTRDISRGVGLSERKIEETQRPIAEVTTTSMDAYNYFLRGREDVEKCYWDDARKFLEKAVELDSTFAIAYLYLAWTYSWLRDDKSSFEALSKAKTFSKKATEKERLYIEAVYACYIEGNSEKQFRILKQMVKKYPKEKRVHATLGDYYDVEGLHSQAIEEYSRSLELDPYYGYAINKLAHTYATMGEYDKAIEYLKKYASVSPGDANPFDSMGELYFIMGRLDEALAKYKEALEVKPDFESEWQISYIYALKEDYTEAMKWVDQLITIASSPGVKAEGYAYKGFYHYWLGDMDESFNALLKAENEWEAIGNEFMIAFVDRLKGFIYYDKGELGLFMKYSKSLIDFNIENWPEHIPYAKEYHNLNLLLADLKEGQIDSARSRLAKIKSLLPEVDLISGKNWITFEYNLRYGEVLLREDSVEKAIHICRKIPELEIPPIYDKWRMIFYCMFPFRDVLARTYKKKGDLDKAITEYERLITFNPESKDRRLIQPKFHYRLAKLYEEKGEKTKAIEQYEKFLEIWKDADEGLPEPIDAKKRLAKLKSTS